MPASIFHFFGIDAPRWRNPGSRDQDPLRLLTYKEPNLVLWNRSTGAVSDTLEREKDWTLLYRDTIAEIWGKSDMYDNPRSPHYLPPAMRFFTEETSAGTVLFPAIAPERNLDTAEIDRVSPQDRCRIVF